MDKSECGSEKKSPKKSEAGKNMETSDQILIDLQEGYRSMTLELAKMRVEMAQLQMNTEQMICEGVGFDKINPTHLLWQSDNPEPEISSSETLQIL